MKFETRAKKWGSSLAIVLPKSVVEASHIHEKETIVVEVKKRHFAKEFFGMASEWKSATGKSKEEMKKGWRDTT